MSLSAERLIVGAGAGFALSGAEKANCKYTCSEAAPRLGVIGSLGLDKHFRRMADLLRKSQNPGGFRLENCECGKVSVGRSKADGVVFKLSAGMCVSLPRTVMAVQSEARAGNALIYPPTAGVDCRLHFGGRNGLNFGHCVESIFDSQIHAAATLSGIDP